ncbi:doublecortin domain-containing protein 2-like isoform X2 [Liolophura sinensis]|uniref:doublecortin domain-containing protein 2-like isoform X2 n=1 Tax=Liolophura sinensis TaxID=3198878 RepID=UPI0031591EBA
MAAADTTLPVIERAKQISVYQNGDEKFPGKRIIINKRKIANFDVFLDHVTDTLRPRFGAVRRLYTPVGGHRVTDLDQVIKRGESYVAAGQEKFHRIGYLEIEVSPRKRLTKGSLDIKPVRHSRIQTSGRIRKIRTEPIIIFVHPNGNDLENPHRVQLRPREQGSWEMVLDAIKERVSLSRGGAIRKLCTLDGRAIHSVHEIQSSGCYVACGTEKFVAKDYEHPKVMTSPRQERRAFPHKLTPLSNRNSKKGSQDSSVNRTPESNNGAMNSRPRKTRRNQVKKEDPVIHEKPVAYKRNGKKEVNYDQDPGGVFKAHRENQATRGAREINEDRNTRVDIPVDQREAEVVEEERIEHSRQDDMGTTKERRSNSNERATPTHILSPRNQSPQPTHESPNPRQESPEPRREYPEPRRESPETRWNSPPRRESLEPRRESPETRWDSPPLRESPEPRRESPKNRKESPEPRREFPENRKESPEPRRESTDSRESLLPAEQPMNDNQREGHESAPPPDRDDVIDDDDIPEKRQSTPVNKNKEEMQAVADITDPTYPGKRGKEKRQSRRGDQSISPSQDERDEAALTIQSHYRGYRTRKEQRQRQSNRRTSRDNYPDDAEAEKAAVMIQSNYRGYRTRRQLKASPNQS